MMEEKSSDLDLFELTIDSFLDFFAEDVETRDTAQVPAEQTIIKPEPERQQEDGAKQNTGLVNPRVMKNDIRRYYSRMFMNTINSGDFNNLQNYFTTFMRGNTKFLANYDNFDPKYSLPSQLVANGPKLMSHFLLGILVMYPDLVMQMDNTVITTSNAWSGTKIEMSVAFSATKLYALSDDEWVPQLHILEDKCSQLMKETRKKLTAAVPSRQCSSSSSASTTSSISSTSSSSSVAHSVFEASNNTSSCDGSGLPRSASSLANDVTHSNRGGALRDRLPVSKRKRAVDVTHNSTDDTMNTTVQLGHQQKENNISEAYVRALCAQAAVLPTPMKISMEGTITMFLDENNCIQHMNMCLTPQIY